MNKNHSELRYAFYLLLLVVCCVNLAHAQPASGTTRPAQPGEQRQRPGRSADVYDGRAMEQAIEQPYNSVLVRIRFKKEYGYKSESNQGGPGLSSCDVFSVGLANAVRPAVANVLIPVRRPEQITEVHGYYHCEFLVSGLALDQDVAVNASIDDQGTWMGGPQSQVPAGYHRVLTDRQRTVTLSQSNPRATMNFEMMFEPMRSFVQPRPSSNPIFRKP